MERDKRRAAIAAYKERKPVYGIYAVKCSAVTQLWIGGASDLSTIKNRLWFTLRLGRSPHHSMQDAWNVYGEGTFTFEILEQHQDDDGPLLQAATLKNLVVSKADALNAIRI